MALRYSRNGLVDLWTVLEIHGNATSQALPRVRTALSNLSRRPQIRRNDAQSPKSSLTRSCQPFDLIRSGFWRVRRQQWSRPRQYCFAPHSRAARRSEVARRAGQSRVTLCTGRARIVDDAEDMVDGRAVVEKQRPIRREAVEQFVECGLSGYLRTCHQIFLRDQSTSLLDRGRDRGEGSSIWPHLKWWQFSFLHC